MMSVIFGKLGDFEDILRVVLSISTSILPVRKTSDTSRILAILRAISMHGKTSFRLYFPIASLEAEILLVSSDLENLLFFSIENPSTEKRNLSAPATRSVLHLK